MSNVPKRRLSLEDLETRRVLNGDPAGLGPPPPMDNNVGLISFDAASRNVSTSDYNRRVDVVDSRFSASTVDQDSPDLQLAGDFNGDDVTDFLSADSAGNWYLHLNDGTRLFELAMGPGVGDARHLGTADFNQDGRLDVASLDEATGDLLVSINNGDSFSHERWGTFNPAAAWSNFYVGDFNGDDRPDILVGERGEHWWLAQNIEGAKFNNYRWGRFADYGWVDVLNGEFTGDGFSDIVARAPDNTWWLWAGGATGFESSRYFGHWRMRSEWKDVAASDFNGDGKDDVIGRSDDGRLWVGSATADGFHTWTWGDGWIDSANWAQVSHVDMNGDGLPDQVGRAKDDTWWYAINSGERFLNHFWQRRGEVDFVLQNFRRSDAVDLSASLPPAESARVVKMLVDDTDRLVISARRAAVIESIRIGDPGGVLSPVAGGMIDGFVSAQGNAWMVELPEPVYVEGFIPLGIAWDPNAGPLNVEVTLSNPLAAKSYPFDLDATVTSGAGTLQLLSEVDPPIQTDTLPQYEQGTISVVDGRVVMRGSFEQLAGIQVRSKGGFLSLEQTSTPFGKVDLRLPFAPTASIVNNNPSDIVIGVLGRNNRIDVEGETQTSILYSGPLNGIEDDLTLDVGVGDRPRPERVPVAVLATDSSVAADPVTDPPVVDPPKLDPPVTDPTVTGSESQTHAPGTAFVQDGRVMLQGPFKQLAGIEVKSSAGLLSLETLNVPGVGDFNSTAPFANGAVVANEANQIVVGVLGRLNRVDVPAGVTPTAFLYGGSAAQLAGGDLSITMGLDDDNLISIPVTT